MDRHCLTDGCTQKTNGGRHVCSKCLKTIRGKILQLRAHCQATYRTQPTEAACRAAVRTVIRESYGGKADRAFTDAEWDYARNLACASTF